MVRECLIGREKWVNGKRGLAIDVLHAQFFCMQAAAHAAVQNAENVPAELSAASIEANAQLLLRSAFIVDVL